MPTLTKRTNLLAVEGEPILLDLKAVCHFFGGSKPLHPSTIYRGINERRYPAPIKLSPGCSRWLLSDCQNALSVLSGGQGNV